MLTAKRRFDPSVIQRLLDEPYRFQFFQAARMLELWLKRNGVSHDNAVAEYLRFKNTVSLGFPASEIEALSLYPKILGRTDVALHEALQDGSLEHISITPAFMGFLGSNGSLPNHYTESIASHQLYEKDESPRAFLDTFSNRTVALFYSAWRKYRLEFKYEVSGQDRFLPLLLSLGGLGSSSLQGKMQEDVDGESEGVLDESMGYFAAAIRHRPASSTYMQSVLGEYFAVPISIEQFVGHWYDVPPAQQTALGSDSAILGSAAMVGSRVWQRDLRMRLTIGPMNKKDFELFLPGRTAAKSLEKMLTMFTGICMEYEVQLVLKAKEVSGASLTSEREGGCLGWDTFLVTEAGINDRSDVRYEIHAV